MSDLRFRLIDLARGTDSVGLLRDLRRWQYESADMLRQRESARLESYLSELRQAVPMFADARRLEDLPILDKRFINAHRKELMNPAYKGKLIRKKTGGSTGEPLVYFTGTESQSYLWAGIFLAWEAAGYRLGDKVAFLAGSSLFGTGYKQRVYYKLLNVTVMSAFDMAPVRMDEYGAELQRGGHSLLYGYASAIHRLARHWLDGGRKPQTRLRGVVCTAEMLTPLMRADIEAAFGVPCFSQYGCNDAGVSAFECEQRNGYHLISTRSLAEVLPDGRLLSTDLTNRAMFMPRYDTGDLVRMSGRVCSCGRSLPLIDEVRGRQNDMVVDPGGQAVHSEFFTHLLREEARVQSFQVVFDDTRLVVNLHTEALNPADQEALSTPYRARIASSLAFDRIDFVFNQPFLTLANGKHRFVMRKPVR
jgi:phenylacetate-CoA ligase